MSESLHIPSTQNKEERYKSLIPQITSLIDGEDDMIANLSNIAAALKETFNFFWVGFYIVKNNQLVLGPFQGPVACTRISFGKGVCGTAWAKKETQIVPDVDNFPGHIRCNPDSKSEIVVPGIMEEQVALVLDIDSNKINDFDLIDKLFLEKIVIDFIKKMDGLKS